MKQTLILTCLLIVGIQSFAKETPAKQAHSAVHVVSRRLDTFIFRTHKEMIGAEIAIYSENGEKMKTEVLTKRHGLVDFYYENPGVYKIVITKGETSETFEYNKTTPSPYIPVEVAHFHIQ